MIAKFLAFIYFLLTAFVIFYVWVMTQDQFQSKAHFSITQEDASQEVTSGLMGLLNPATQSDSDTQLLIGYITSADLLKEIEEKFNLAEH